MSQYRARLLKRQELLGRGVRVGVVGAGQMGRGLITQITRMAGMDVAVVVARRPERAVAAFELVGITDYLVVDVAAGLVEVSEIVAAVEAGRPLVVTDIELLSELPLDFVFEGTGVPEIGARVAVNALRAGQDVGMLNVECDVTIGYLLTELSKQLDRVYTVCRGDEPAEAKRLVDFARELTFEVIVAGKGKNNPLIPHSVPDDLLAEAASKQMNPRMLCEFVDGSKAMIEMAALANATGLPLSKRGMHGPATSIADLDKTYRLIGDGGILERAGVIDYCTGDVAPGVFVVVRVADETIHEELHYLKLGAGPYFALYRPYHLASVEAPLSIGEAILDREASLQPVAWLAEVFAAAKRDLVAGDVIDGIGGRTIYGMADSADAVEFVPLGLLAGARVIRPVGIDELVRWDDVEIDPSSTLMVLRQLQNQLLDGRLARDDLVEAITKALP